MSHFSLLLRRVVEVEASIRAWGFVDCKVLWHQVRGLAGLVHSCENVWRSDLVGSSSSRILYCCEGGDEEHVARISKQIIRVYNCFLSLSLTLSHSILLHATIALFHIATCTLVPLLLMLISLLVSLLKIVFYYSFLFHIICHHLIVITYLPSSWWFTIGIRT